jgi:hypothetical protein
MAYIKSTTTGEVFPINEHLLKRGDMVPCNIDGSPIELEVEEEAEKPRPTRQRKPKVDVSLNDDLDTGEV